MYILLQQQLKLIFTTQHYYVDIFHDSTKHVLFPQQLFYEHTFTKTT